MNEFGRLGTPKDWSEEDKKLIDWFLNLPESDYPKTPFFLRQSVRVVDFFTALKQDIEAGAGGPRTKYRALQGDIEDLKKIIESR